MDSVCIYGFDSFRSLSDIKKIIELMELLKDTNENEDLDDCRFMAIEKILTGDK